MVDWFTHTLVRLAGGVFFLWAVAVAAAVSGRGVLLEVLRLLGLRVDRQPWPPHGRRPSLR